MTSLRDLSQTAILVLKSPEQEVTAAAASASMSSSKRTRRAESDRGRSPVPGQNDHDLMTLFKQFSDTVIRKLDNRAAEKWPKEYETYLACPFRRHNPARYANVLDCACTGYGFKDIADLRYALFYFLVPPIDLPGHEPPSISKKIQGPHQTGTQ